MLLKSRSRHIACFSVRTEASSLEPACERFEEVLRPVAYERKTVCALYCAQKTPYDDFSAALYDNAKDLGDYGHCTG